VTGIDRRRGRRRAADLHPGGDRPDVFRGEAGSFYEIVLVNTSFNSSAHFKVSIEKK